MARYRFLSKLPMPGQEAGVIVSSYFYPFLLPTEMDQMPRGGKAAKWWWRVKVWRIHLTWSGTIEDTITGATTKAGDLTFDLFPLDPGGPVHFLDERDRRDPRWSRWGGIGDSAIPFGPFATVGFQLMPLTPISAGFIPDWLGYPADFAGPSYYEVPGVAIAPLFILQGSVGHHSDTFDNVAMEFPIRSYPRNANDAGLGDDDFPGGSKGMGTGLLDGEEFLTYAIKDNPLGEGPDFDQGWSLNSLGITITPHEFWGWDGMFNTGSGDLIEESTDYDDP